MRRSPVFASIKAALPAPRPSEFRPGYPDLSEEEAFERLLLQVSDTVWDEIWGDYCNEKAAKEGSTGPIVTGDAVVDAWEKELFEKFKGGK